MQNNFLYKEQQTVFPCCCGMNASSLDPPASWFTVENSDAFLPKIVFLHLRFPLEMQRNFGRNSGFKPVSAETEIRECFGRNYLNFRGFILPLLSVPENWEGASCFLNQNNCLILWKWLKIVKKYPNFNKHFDKCKLCSEKVSKFANIWI